MKYELILAILTKREKRQFFFVLFSFLIMGFIELLGVGSIGPFISIISNPEVIHTNIYLNKAYNYFNFSNDTSFIIAFGIIVIVVFAVSNICLSLISFIIFFYSGERRHSISMRLFERYLRQPYVFYLNINTAELSKIILTDVNYFVGNVLIHLLNLISCFIVSSSIVILFLIVNPLASVIITLVLGVLYFLIFTLVRKYLGKKGIERSVQNTLKYKYVNESFGGIKDIKILGKEKVFLDSFSGPSQKFARNDAISEVVNEVPKYLIETIAIGGMLSIIMVMVHTGGRIENFLPILTIYAFGAYRMLPLLQKMFKSIASIKYNFPIVENLYNDLKKLPEGISLNDENIKKMEINNNIKLENIVFSYPNNDKEVIRNQTLTIKANSSIALVGSTGCGKTTFVDIVLGLLYPKSGKLCIDGIEIDDNNRKSYQKNLGYVPQSIYLTDDTIRNNIAFGISSEKIDDNQIIQAAKLANIHSFILEELKDGYDTIIGERGIRLSGGQRQRIGIARAVYHNPSVLILDEATSSLDSMTENAIMDAIKNMVHKKTIIMVAHRITTVKNCDVIYIMEKGIIIDKGNYQDLYQNNSTFKKMADGL
jgi:ABC-type multidrug transport system fused ATPase/permease subunit